METTDSMLHECWASKDHTNSPSYEGDRSHIEYITIPGAKITDLINVWKIEYFQNTPKDVILIAGLSSILKGYKPDDMLREYDHLATPYPDLCFSYHCSVYMPPLT